MKEVCSRGSSPYKDMKNKASKRLYNSLRQSPCKDKLIDTFIPKDYSKYSIKTKINPNDLSRFEVKKK